MAEEAREMMHTAANFIFIAAVLLTAMMFFNLRANYGDTISQRVIISGNLLDANRYAGFNSQVVGGYDVINAIASHSRDVPVLVVGAYSHVTGAVVHAGREYNSQTRISNPDWFRVSVHSNPLLDPAGMQSRYRDDTRYFAILTYDAENPDMIARLMGIQTQAGRNMGVASSTLEQRVAWVNERHREIRPVSASGSRVSGIIFVLVDVPNASAAVRQQVSIH
jgi:hypothetical protein